MDYAVHGILQARILEWVVFPFSRGYSQPRDWIQVSNIAGRFFTSWATGKPKNTEVGSQTLLQWIFPTQESNQGLLHCRWILYQLRYQGSPMIVLVPLNKEEKKDIYPPHTHIYWGNAKRRHTQKSASQEKGLSRSQIGGTLTLYFPTSRPVRNKFLLFKSPQSVVFCYSSPNWLIHSLLNCYSFPVKILSREAPDV